MRDIFAEDEDHGEDFSDPEYDLTKFAGTTTLDHQQLAEILGELESMPPPALIRQDMEPVFRWSKAPLEASGITSLDLKWSNLIVDIRRRLGVRTDSPITEPSIRLSVEEILDEEDNQLRAEWGASDWIPARDCCNSNAEAYLRHLATTKDLVWFKDAYKTTYFMLDVGASIGNTSSDIPVSYKGFISITTSKFILDANNEETLCVIKKLKVALKKLSLTQQSKKFLGDDFINVVDNTASARPVIQKILDNPDYKLILEMKLNPVKKTVFFAPIGAAYRGSYVSTEC